jgi:hypothetical protein
MVINSQLLEDLRRGGRRDEAKQAVRARENMRGNCGTSGSYKAINK